MRPPPHRGCVLVVCAVLALLSTGCTAGDPLPDGSRATATKQISDSASYDSGAVFDYRFTSDELSTWDWFHPDESGQAELARIMAGVAFSATAP